MKRRDFAKWLGQGAVLPAFMNGLTFQAFGKVVDEVDEKSDHVLVLINLSGGNDGLNMVVPIDFYGNYQNARRNIALDEAKLLKISDKTGLHPAMSGLFDLYKQGKVRVVQSVGYPNPNFSHFRATDIWQTGSDANQTLATGWAGRYFSYYHPNYPNGYPNQEAPDPLAIQIGSTVSTVLQGPVASMGMAITSPTSFYNLINNKYDVDVPNTSAGKELAYIRKMASQSNEYASTIKNAAAKIPTQATYPSGNSLADQLKIVARLIAGGLRTKIYMVNLGGFDTHATQAIATDTATGTHAVLMQKLSEGISAFMADLKQQGVSKKVLGMTYSEFGRRIKSNDSGGTDHGSAAPVLLFGDQINGGITGKSVEISASVATGDNIPMQYDFRSVYASILQDWFCMPTADISNALLKNYQSLGLVNAQACGITLATESQPFESLKCYPNPFDQYTTLKFDTPGGHNLIQVFNAAGQLVAMPIDDNFAMGSFDVPINTSSWGSGAYFARHQNEAKTEVIRIMKR